jgi:hypothetical protein
MERSKHDRRRNDRKTGGARAGNGPADRDIPPGTRRPSGGVVGGECIGTKEAKPNRPSEAVVRRPRRLITFSAFRRAVRRSVPVVPEPT